MAIFVILPGATGPTFNQFLLGAGANYVAAVDPGNPPAHDDATSYIRNLGDGQVRQRSYLLASRPAISAITDVYGFMRARGAGAPNSMAMQMRAVLNGVVGSLCPQQLLTATNVWQSTSGNGILLPRPGGGTWTIADIYNSTLEIVAFGGSAGATFDVTSLYINVDGAAAPTTIEAPRSRATRDLRLKGRGFVSLISGVVPMVMSDNFVGDLVSVTDETAPIPVGLGWGMSSSLRRPTIKTEQNLDLNSMELSERYFDTRRYLTTLWMTTKTERMPTLADDGAGLMAAGSTRTFTRTSKAWGTNAAAGKSNTVQYVEIGTDVKKFCTEGLLIEGANTNDVKNSIFLQGPTTQWTNVATVADTTRLLFVDAASLPLSARSLRMTRVASGACSIVNTTAISYTGAPTLFATVIHHDETAGGALNIFIQDTVDNFYWNFTTTAWQAGSTSTPLPERATPTADHVGPIVLRSGTRTITISIQATSVADQVNNVYGVNFSKSQWPSSFIVTQGAAITRAVDNYQITNNASATCVNPTEGTFYATVSLNWNDADITGSGKFFLWKVVYDSNNSMSCYWDVATDEWRFQVIKAGTNYNARLDAAVIRGTTYPVACRWTATTASIFATNVKGDDVALTAGLPTQTTTSTLYIGHDETPANHLEGYFTSELEWVQFAMTDDEILGKMI